MIVTQKLFRIKTFDLGEFWVVAKDLNTAESELNELLLGVGQKMDGRIMSIDIVSETISDTDASIEGQIKSSKFKRLLVVK